MRSVGTVRVWHREQGWGVIDCSDTPGGCWVHFGQLWNDGLPQAGPGEVVEVSGGFREAFEGDIVDFDWETPGQDRYGFRATAARPRGHAPHRVIRHYSVGEHPDPGTGFEMHIGRAQQLDHAEDGPPVSSNHHWLTPAPDDEMPGRA